jgi:hypothetical protein
LPAAVDDQVEPADGDVLDGRVGCLGGGGELERGRAELGRESGLLPALTDHHQVGRGVQPEQVRGDEADGAVADHRYPPPYPAAAGRG